MAATLIGAAVTLSACHPSMPFAAYQHPRDAWASAFPIVRIFGIYPCATLERGKYGTVLGVWPFYRCYKMQPPRHYHGIWVDEMEDSHFYESLRPGQNFNTELKRRLTRPEVILDFAPEAGGPRLPMHNDRDDHYYVLDFIGRETTYVGDYGSMSRNRIGVVVDRLLAAREIDQPKPTSADRH